MGADEGNAKSCRTQLCSMNREIIWETAVNDIPALKQFCEEQLAEN